MRGKVTDSHNRKRDGGKQMKTNENSENTLLSPIRRRLLGAAGIFAGEISFCGRAPTEGQGDGSPTAGAIHQKKIFYATRKKSLKGLTVPPPLYKKIDKKPAQK